MPLATLCRCGVTLAGKQNYCSHSCRQKAYRNRKRKPYAFPIPKNTDWIITVDGDRDCLELYKRHYSCNNYKDQRVTKLFAGPGEKIVLITPDKKAVFVWRKFKNLDHQAGINCAVFRNETGLLSSDLIKQAELFAAYRWPGARFYTYVDPKKVSSKNPGYCFKKAGWNVCGITKKRSLLILEKTIGLGEAQCL